MRDRLIELISKVQYMGGLEEKLADHLLAEGVIVPPCKVGDTLFSISPTTKSIDDGYEFLGIESSRNGVWEDTMIQFKLTDGYRYRTKYHFCWKDIGRTVFLTREEAERALAEMKGGE